MLHFQVIALCTIFLITRHRDNFVTKRSMEIYVPDKWVQEFSIPPGYYEKVIEVIDALRKAGIANLTDVVVT